MQDYEAVATQSTNARRAQNACLISLPTSLPSPLCSMLLMMAFWLQWAPLVLCSPAAVLWHHFLFPLEQASNLPRLTRTLKGLFGQLGLEVSSLVAQQGSRDIKRLWLHAQPEMMTLPCSSEADLGHRD